MLTLTCPHCGIKAEETELSPGGEAHLRRFGPGASDEDFADYMFARKNPKGVHFERWRHAYGCGKWFLAARCTVTLEVFGTYPAALPAPPEEILARIRARRPEFAGFDAPGPVSGAAIPDALSDPPAPDAAAPVAAAEAGVQAGVRVGAQPGDQPGDQTGVQTGEGAR